MFNVYSLVPETGNLKKRLQNFNSLCQGTVSSESAKMCRAKRSRAELKHFEKLNFNVNGLPISEQSHRLHITITFEASRIHYSNPILRCLWTMNHEL